MRFRRLRLNDYRGIDESEVDFSPDGLTVVEGPNEAGKTSLSEAIRILFDYLDSSRHSDVKAIKPVNRDVGPSIELEAESGPFIFTYFKRFHRKPETTLQVTSPRLENYTGREAHERAEEILRETIDVDLWKALCIQQGEMVHQADLSKQTSLSAALDIAAGGHRTDPREESLFDRVREEYGRYFTPGGGEKKELQKARTAEESTRSEVEELEIKIRSLENDADRVAELNRELGGLEKQAAELQEDFSRHTEALDEISKLETDLDTARLKLESAKKSQEAARRDWEIRRNLIEAVSQLKKSLVKLEESSTSSAAPLKNAEENLLKAASKASKAEARRKDADELLSLRREDFDYFTDKLHLEQLKERKARIDRNREKAIRDDEVLSSNRVDEAALKKIQQAERSLIMAQAGLEAGAPNILLRGLADSDISIDEELVRISKQEERSITVSDRVCITIPDALQVEVKAGSSSSDLARKVEEAKQTLEVECRNAGVNSADEAKQFYDARRDAKQSIERLKELEKEDLRDLAYEELERKVKGLGKRVPAYPEARITGPGLPGDLEEAKKELRKAEEDQKKSGKALEEARKSMEEARKVEEGLSSQHQKVIVELQLKNQEFTRAEDELERSRSITSDGEVEASVIECDELVTLEEGKVVSVDAALSGMEPDRVRALAETANASLGTVGKKYKAAQQEIIEVRTRLRVQGEEGLQEKLDAAQSRLIHLRAENEAMFRRANAAGLLYLTMREERDNSRRAYVAPLKEKIERLGRLVFSNSFQVDLTEDLSVSSRAMEGSSVPFESLSGGTKEQISLISRLACAMTVSKNGGAPLILDDALGYTDPERLKLMGAVLARAGKECQIIILTCVPDRYSNVGEAKVVRLG